MVVKDNELGYIEIDVRCIGCGKSMTPNTTEWTLFRAGVRVHSNDDCLDMAYKKLETHHDG